MSEVLGAQNGVRPPAAWDCHAHVFGPYATYPLAAERAYTPPEAQLPAYDAHLAALGMVHGVLVHPSAYGDDHRLVLDVLASRPHLRGVLVAQPEALPALAGMHDRRVRALRFSARSGSAVNFKGSASFEDLRTMAKGMADAGLHAELWTDHKQLPQLADSIRELPVPVVIDHMGGFDANAGVNEPGFRCLIELLSEGRVWVKLCAYRNLLSIKERGHWAEALGPYQNALWRTNPENLVWGSDWPYLNVMNPPSGADLMQLLRESVDDRAAVQAILIDNPARLYR